MPEEKKTEEVVVPVTTEEKKTTEVVEQDPLKTELEKVQRKGKTRTEKLLYTRKRIDEQLKEEGVELEEPEDDDSKPMTRGDFKKLQAQTATKSALDLANEVSNETERELLKYHLENTIRSTGNPQEDFKLAQSLVNSVKNNQIVEEIQRKPITKSAPTGGGAPARETKPDEELSADEMTFMRPPYNLSKQQILDARKGKDLHPAPAGINQKQI